MLAEGDELTEPKVEQTEDTEGIQRALVEEKERAEKYLTNWQRSQADLENYIKRAEQEKSEIITFANKTLILDLLPVLDDFERALAVVPAELREQNWTKGIQLIYNKLKAILELQEVAEIKARGECFDPYFHEAVGQGDGEEGVVIEEIRKGYTFKGKLLRPSMVIIGQGKKNEIPQESLEDKQNGQSSRY